MKDKVQLFENQRVRSVWDDEKEDWFFSVVDVVGILSGSTSPKAYWRKLKERLNKEGAQPVTKCHALKMKAADGRMRLTDVATIEQLLRIIQSIPSPKAEPFKQWLAQVGSERLDEEIDPQKAIDRARETYRKKGYPEPWIKARLQGIQIRNDLTDEWKAHGVHGDQYAVLTGILHKGTFDISVKEHKKLKGLKKENLRDNMTSLESVLTSLAEVTDTEITRAKNPKTMAAHEAIANSSGEVARQARLSVEKRTGKSAVSKLTAKELILGKDDPANKLLEK